MIFNYRVPKLVQKDGEYSLEFKDFTLQSLSFEEMIKANFNSYSELENNINNYNELMSKKHAQKIVDVWVNIVENDVINAETVDFSNLDRFESIHEFTKAFRDLETDAVEPPHLDPRLLKLKKRYKIAKTVRDDADSIADIAKWVSLLTSCVEEIYKVLPEETKDLIPAEKKALMEFAFSKFDETTTIGDYTLANKGEKMITDILDKESRITEVVKNTK